jgi:hypothetical protein
MRKVFTSLLNYHDGRRTEQKGKEDTPGRADHQAR